MTDNLRRSYRIDVTSVELENIILKRKVRDVLKMNEKLEFELAAQENLLDSTCSRHEEDLKKVLTDNIITEKVQSEYIESLKYSLIELHKKCKDLEVIQLSTSHNTKSKKIVVRTEQIMNDLISRKLEVDKEETLSESWKKTCEKYFGDMNLIDGELLEWDYTMKGSTFRTLFEAFLTRSMQIECCKFFGVEDHSCWCCELDRVPILIDEVDITNVATTQESGVQESESESGSSDTESFVEVNESNERSPLLVV